MIYDLLEKVDQIYKAQSYFVHILCLNIYPYYLRNKQVLGNCKVTGLMWPIFQLISLTLKNIPKVRHEDIVSSAFLTLLT